MIEEVKGACCVRGDCHAPVFKITGDDGVSEYWCMNAHNLTEDTEFKRLLPPVKVSA